MRDFTHLSCNSSLISPIVSPRSFSFPFSSPRTPSNPSLVVRTGIGDVYLLPDILQQVWVARNPPGFAFVWFADDRDATDAVREVDGRSIGGREWRVEIVSVHRLVVLCFP